MANVIIGIHGLGNKPPRSLLEQWWKLAMIEGLKREGYNPVLPKFELVYWADLLYDKPFSITEKDKESPHFLREKYTEARGDFPIENHSTRKKIIDFIDRQINHIFLNEDFSLNYSAITDAIISKYFKDLDIYYKEDCTQENESVCKTKELINKRLIEVLRKYKGYDIMLIAHSMGSIIAYDVLNFETPETSVKYFITIGSPLGLPVVIGKIAAEQKRRLNGVNHMNTPPTVSKNWYNFSDILDKIALNYKLADDFSENEQGIKPVDFLIVNDFETGGEKNPHKSFGYLRAGEFSKILNEFILTEKLTMKEIIIHNTAKILYRIKSRFQSKK